MAEEGTILRWSAYEHEHIERGSDWFWALGIAAVCIAITAALFHDTLFGIVVLLAAATIALHAKQPPELMEFEVSEKGVRIGGTLHRFEEIIGFWVEDEHASPPLLLIDTPKFMAPNFIIPIVDVEPEKV